MLSRYHFIYLPAFMRPTSYFGLYLLLLASHYLSAQTIIFPDLKGQELIEALRSTYRPNVVLSYNEARDELFAYTANANDDTLRCVYTGYSFYLPPSEDPSAYAYENGIDTEHTYPQSKGAGNQPAKSDMHHLFPVRSNVNSSRGNDPYAEIPDTETNKWYRNAYDTGLMPTSYIDEYSEHDNETQTFEPREDHKGNAARAVFYFYTMYYDEATAADPAFFDIQKTTLYQWHRQDLVNTPELQRNNFIAPLQEGKSNPFIIDPTLVQRAYFPNDTATIDTILPPPINPHADSSRIIQYAAPNPSSSDITINYHLPDEADVLITIFDRQGNIVEHLVNGHQAKGWQSAVWNGTSGDGSTVPEGLYIARLSAVINDRTVHEQTLLISIR